ncbi:MAG TPA: hypothetical protein VHD87_15185 [Acidimicrobiales bacterium]|nr:hypothetical protein [Acidimicrobiales bacterium]
MPTRTAAPLEVDDLVKVNAPGFKKTEVFIIREFRADGTVILYGGTKGYLKTRIAASRDVLERAKKGTPRPDGTTPSRSNRQEAG